MAAAGRSGSVSFAWIPADEHGCPASTDSGSALFWKAREDWMPFLINRHIQTHDRFISCLSLPLVRASLMWRLVRVCRVVGPHARRAALPQWKCGYRPGEAGPICGVVDDLGGCRLPGVARRDGQLVPDAGADARARYDPRPYACVASFEDHRLAKDAAAAGSRRPPGCRAGRRLGPRGR